MYVGITRAQSKLYLSRAQMRYRFGESAFASPSRFLSEIGEEQLEVVHGRIARAAPAEYAPRAGHTHRRVAPERKVERDAQYFADESPDYENESQDALEIKAGTYVRHEMFGKGKVIRVAGKGDAMKVVVDFEEFGVKNLLVRFARLRPA